MVYIKNKTTMKAKTPFKSNDNNDLARKFWKTQGSHIFCFIFSSWNNISAFSALYSLLSTFPYLKVIYIHEKLIYVYYMLANTWQSPFSKNIISWPPTPLAFFFLIKILYSPTLCHSLALEIIF